MRAAVSSEPTQARSKPRPFKFDRSEVHERPGKEMEKGRRSSKTDGPAQKQSGQNGASIQAA